MFTLVSLNFLICLAAASALLCARMWVWKAMVSISPMMSAIFLQDQPGR